MYTLYFNKINAEIKVKKARVEMQNGINYTEEVTQYNPCYYVCLNMNPLIEKANEIKKTWVDEAEADMKRFMDIKI